MGQCVNCAKKYVLEDGECKEGVSACVEYVMVARNRICDQCE